MFLRTGDDKSAHYFVINAKDALGGLGCIVGFGDLAIFSEALLKSYLILDTEMIFANILVVI